MLASEGRPSDQGFASKPHWGSAPELPLCNLAP